MLAFWLYSNLDGSRFLQTYTNQSLATTCSKHSNRTHPKIHKESCLLQITRDHFDTRCASEYWRRSYPFVWLHDVLDQVPRHGRYHNPSERSTTEKHETLCSTCRPLGKFSQSSHLFSIGGAVPGLTLQGKAGHFNPL